MNSSKIKFTLPFLFILQFSFAQEITNKLTDYFKHQRESIYLHVNKSSFVNGENIWFQGYVMNRKTKFLNPNARNAYVQIFDEEGNEIVQHMYLVRSGTFEGTVELTEDFEPGNYYLVAQTKWMQNFKEPDLHIQSFEILNDEKIEETIAQKEAYDLQILPESGYLVDGLSSTIGLKLIDQNGKGVDFEAQLFENNSLIYTVKSNFLGIAKMPITPNSSNAYVVKAKLKDNKLIEQSLPEIMPSGVVLTLNTLAPQNVMVALKSNFSSTENLKPEDHRILVHQEGKYFEIPVNASDRELDFTYAIAKQNLFYGVNTITYFYKNQPVAERLFFHYPPNLSKLTSVEAYAKPLVNKDSIFAELNLEGLENNFAKMSISILPGQTIALKANQSLASNLYLSPYVNGFIENASYYFTNVNRKKEAELDQLLLTQGWSRYTWDNIFGDAPAITTPPENGVEAKLKIKNNLNKDQNQLLVQNTTFHESMVYDIAEDKIIDLASKYLIQGERITMSLVGKKKKLQNFKRFDFDIDFQLMENELPAEAFKYSFSNKTEKTTSKSNTEVNDLKLNDFGESELLGEVIISSSAVKKKDFYTSDQESYEFGFDGKFLKVTEEEAQTFTFLSDYLNYSGFRVYDNLAGQFEVINNRGGQPLIFLNNSRLNDASMLSGMRLDQFETVYYDKTGYGGGVAAQGGVLRLRLRQTPIFTNPSDVTSSSISTIIDKGFQPIPEYYMPAYGFFDSEPFRKIGAIDFKTNITTENGIVNFQFYDTKLPEVIFFIEGITDNGGYIQLKVPVEIEN